MPPSSERSAHERSSYAPPPPREESRYSDEVRGVPPPRDPYPPRGNGAAPEYEYKRSSPPKEGGNGYEYAPYGASSSSYGPTKSSYSSSRAAPYSSK